MDLEEGEIIISSEDEARTLSREVQTKEGMYLTNRNSLTKHSFHKGSVCSGDIFRPDDCYVSHLRSQRTHKEDQSRITTTFIREETRQMRASRSGSIVSYSTTNKYSWHRDSNSKPNKCKNKLKPIRTEKPYNSNGGRVNEYASIMEPLYKKKKNRSRKKKGKPKQSSQNSQCSLMNKLITAGLTKRTSSSTISSLQAEVGSSKSLCSVEHDRSETSTIASLHAEVGSSNSIYLDESDPATSIKTENPTSGYVITNEDSDSEIEVIIPPPKVHLVVTLDSDGEEVAISQDGKTTENKETERTEINNARERNDSSMKSVCNSSSELLNPSTYSDRDFETNKDEISVQNDCNTLSDSSILCVDDELPTYSPSSPSTCSNIEDNEPYSPSVGPIIDCSSIFQQLELNKVLYIHNKESSEEKIINPDVDLCNDKGLPNNNQNDKIDISSSVNNESYINENGRDSQRVESISEIVENDTNNKPNEENNDFSTTKTIEDALKERILKLKDSLSSREETINVIDHSSSTSKNDDVTCSSSNKINTFLAREENHISPSISSSISDVRVEAFQEEAYTPPSDYDKILCSATISVTSNMTEKSVLPDKQAHSLSVISSTDNDNVVNNLKEINSKMPESPKTADVSNAGNILNEEFPTNVIATNNDEEDDISQLRLIALSSKGKLQSSVKSSTSNENVSQSNTSADDDDCDDDVLQLRVAALKSAVIKKHEERKKRGFLFKKRKHTSSGLGEDLLSISNMSEASQFADNKTPEEEIAAPDSPALSTKSLQGEEDMEIADSDSGGDIIQDINAENHQLLQDPEECLNPVVSGAAKEFLSNEHIPLTSSILPPPPPPPLLFPNFLPPPPPPPLPPSEPVPPLQQLDLPPASTNEHFQNVIQDMHCLPHQSSNNILYNQPEIDHFGSSCATISQDVSEKSLNDYNVNPGKSLGGCTTKSLKRGQTRSNLKPISVVKNTPKDPFKRKQRSKQFKKQKFNPKLLCITNTLANNNDTQNVAGPIKNMSLCSTVPTAGKEKLNVVSDTSNNSIPLCTTENSLVVDNWADCDEFSEVLYRNSKHLVANPIKTGKIDETQHKEKVTNEEIDLSDMIVLDEVGFSPEHKTTYDQYNDIDVSGDQDDEDALRVQALTSLPKATSKPASSYSRSLKCHNIPVIPPYKHNAKRENYKNMRNDHINFIGSRLNSKQHDFENLLITRKADSNDKNKYRLSRIIVNEPPRRSVVHGKESLKVVIPSESKSVTLPSYPSPPVVDRFVIKVGQDSDSEDDGEWRRRVRVESPKPVPLGPVVDQELERSIDLLLLSARQNVENASVAKPLPTQQKFPSTNSSKITLPRTSSKPSFKSDDSDTPLRLLPKELQEEYQMLKKIIEEKERLKELQSRRVATNKPLKKSQSPLQNVLLSEANKVNKNLSNSNENDYKITAVSLSKMNVLHDTKLNISRLVQKKQTPNVTAQYRNSSAFKAISSKESTSSDSVNARPRDLCGNDLGNKGQQEEDMKEKLIETTKNVVINEPVNTEGGISCFNSTETSKIREPISSHQTTSEISDVAMRNEVHEGEGLNCISKDNSNVQAKTEGLSDEGKHPAVNLHEEETNEVVSNKKSTTIPCSLMSVKENELDLLMKDQTELVSERYMLLDELDELSESLGEMEQKQAKMTKTIWEIEDLRKKLAEAEQFLKAEYDAARVLEETLQTARQAVDNRHAKIEHLEALCCSRGSTLDGPAFKLQTSGKKIMDKKVIQVNDKLNKTQHQREIIMKFLEIANDKKISVSNVDKSNSFVKNSSALNTNESLGHPRSVTENNVLPSESESESPNRTELVEPITHQLVLTKFSDLDSHQSSVSVVEKNVEMDTQSSSDVENVEAIKSNSPSKKRSIAEVCNDSEDCNNIKKSNNADNQINYLELTVTEKEAEKKTNSKNQLCGEVPNTSTLSSSRTKKSFLQYNSVLQYKKRNSTRTGMQASSSTGAVVICPYDLAGKCQDTQCRYQHFPPSS